MTYRIAICDDEISTCESLDSILREISDTLSLRIDVEVFYSGETLVSHMTCGATYHFVFLDIELFELSGVEVSRYIRENKKDFMCQIVFISSKTAYAMELFQFQPLDFIVKPICREKVERVIIKGLRTIGILRDSFDCTLGKSTIRTPMSQILYFESKGRQIKLVTGEGEIEFYDRISRVEQTLPPAFIRIHKSYIVNINAVRICRYDRVILFDGCELPISRSYRDVVKEQIMKGTGVL